ncbi:MULTISPECIES: class I SAM-dependent methyltransferase [Ruminococcus]|uniref:Class I SAM-dependent methyltransferase n=1 Tax=Ruminococcus gauvreauii TaxID=438033 RepID=A0ABY5VDX4_9FIRM|nr:MULTISPECIES: class I SAM-dependent methyltransferase [Ruminococcus]MCH1982690.1 class I SAM-dependent methyltransferase [Ruminococcus sp. OA3]UWP58824.1 class I SAM-dependent methyltransferase [Ruminococcus gauvreauii]
MYIKEKITDYWSDRAESYSQQNQFQLTSCYDKWKSLLLQYAPDRKNTKILDVGTGPGFFAILLAKEGYQVTAVDQNAEMLRCAQENARQAGVDICFLQTGDELPFADGSMDMIVARDVTWMQLEPEKVLESWYRILKKDGCLLYFDAEWYGYLRDERQAQEYRSFRRYVKEQSGFVYEKANEMERLAAEFPLTYQERPKWDGEFWKSLNPRQVSCKTELNPIVYSEIEQLQYAKTPEFLVCVQK